MLSPMPDLEAPRPTPGPCIRQKQSKSGCSPDTSLSIALALDRRGVGGGYRRGSSGSLHLQAEERGLGGAQVSRAGG